MKLYEYQGKEIFREYGVPVPSGAVVSSADEAADAANSLTFPLAVKCQLLRGKRGKSGLIRRVGSVEELREAAADLLGKADWGASEPRLLLEPWLDIQKEFMVSITADPVSGGPVLLASTFGGMDVEEAAEDPEKLKRYTIDIVRGLQPFHARNIAYDLGLRGKSIREGAALFFNLYRAFRGCDAELVEINPLTMLSDGSLTAMDSKINIDDSALGRQKRFLRGRDQFDTDTEYEAAKEGFSYVTIYPDGDIGIMCAGAGLTMTVIDLIHQFGGRPANFLEFGGPLYQRTVKAMRFALVNPRIKVLVICVFGLIARTDVIAEGLAVAIKENKPRIPLVVCMRGTGQERAWEILREVGLESEKDNEVAIRRAIAIAGGSE
ncbi:MAG: succinate--CoA ligase subunit beta [Deltaproteobacteria bacterium]|nr:succinate--CoA ligase subunit beta [Deltaproteobacteria bacterium]MBW2305930.1 succinate--CoA ligase subunit beta [Deltaproteobacteria bacterium]